MRDNEAENIPGNREARFLLQIALTAVVCVGVILRWGPHSSISITAVHVLPLVMMIALWPAVQLVRLGTGRSPFGVVCLGVVYVFGGAAFDMFATYWHSPDLVIEENPIARTLLDSGHSLRFVYGYAIVAQTLLALMTCVLWAGLFRHHQFLASTLRTVDSPLLFIRAATGGRDLAWRAWMLPVKASELPQSYHVVWALTAMLFASSAHRWYLGLEWFGLAGRSRVIVPVVTVLTGLAAHLWGLWLTSRTPVAKPHESLEDF